MISTYVHNTVQKLTKHHAKSGDTIVYYYILWYFLCYVGLSEEQGFECVEAVEEYIIETLTQDHVDGFLYNNFNDKRHQKIRLVVLNRYIGLLDLSFEIPPYIRRRQNITSHSDNPLQCRSKYLRNKLICALFADMQLSRSQIQCLSLSDIAGYTDFYWLPNSALPQTIQDLVELYLNQRSGQVHLDYRESNTNLVFNSSHSGKRMKLNSISKIIRNSLY